MDICWLFNCSPFPYKSRMSILKKAYRFAGSGKRNTENKENLL